MLKAIAISLIALSLTACITVEIPAPVYPEPSEAADSVSESADVSLDTEDTKDPKSEAGNRERSTPRPANTARPAATVHPVKQRPDTSQMVVISNGRLSSRDMMSIFENNIHLAEKAFDNKWLWFVEESVERVERNRLRLYTGSNERVLYARFPSDSGLEDIGGQVEMLCFDPTLTARNDMLTLTVSDCEIITNPLTPDGWNN